MTLEFWFDFSSPYAYLGSTQIEALAARAGTTVTWRPVLLGALFRAVGQVDAPIASYPSAKQVYMLRDLERYADRYGVPFHWSPHFPIRTVLPLRVFLAHPDPVPFLHRAFRAAWGEGVDLADPAALRALGVPDEVLTRAGEQRQALIDHTQAAVDAGMFGVPTCRVDGRWLFWGQDRFDQVERALSGWVPPV